MSARAIRGHPRRRTHLPRVIGSRTVNVLGGLAMTPTQSATPQGFVLGAGEGERLAHFADAGEIFIRVGPATGSASFALGTQQVRAGGGIPVHRHWEKDEAFYVLEGSGIFSLNDVSYPIEKGTTIFIPGTFGTGSLLPNTSCCCS